MSNQHREMKVFTTKQVSKKGVRTAFNSGRRSFLHTAPEVFVFIDEAKKKNRVWSFHCLYGDLLVQSTQNQGGGEAVPVKKAASLGMAAETIRRRCHEGKTMAPIHLQKVKSMGVTD